MNIALTGSSSTGKTTLMNNLLKELKKRNIVSKKIIVDSRSLLEKMGCHSMDLMTREKLREFQMEYFILKFKAEFYEDKYITDRSFLDIAAHWLIRDTFDLSNDEQEYIEGPCKLLARHYDLHIYLPFGKINFEPDGFRSDDINFHKKIDKKILYYLKSWNLKFIKLEDIAVGDRTKYVLKYLDRISI